jgi:hypothetical protein
MCVAQAPRDGGVGMVVGIGSAARLALPLQQAMLREVDMRGSFRIANASVPTSLTLPVPHRVFYTPCLLITRESSNSPL